MKRKILFVTSALIPLLFMTFAPVGALSSPQPGANGYDVSPLLNSLVVNAGTTGSVTLYVQNISNAVERVSTIVNDFIESPSNNGTPELLLNGGHSSHSLKQFITVPVSNFVLNPGNEETVNVNITIPANTASGGYFAAVRFAPQSLGTAKNINLSGSVASLILVTVPGNLNENLNIAKLGAGNGDGQIHKLFTSNKDIYGVVYFNNSGNVQLQPFGNFSVRSGTRDVFNAPVNKTNGYVLPGSERYFTVKLKNVGSFGKYTLYGDFGYGSKGQLISATATFYVIPLWLMWTSLAIVLLLILLVVIYLRTYHKSGNK
ncbi:MAG: hypothetical protein ACREF7_02000 [Candidatus Saccharimonadales bacterium]